MNQLLITKNNKQFVIDDINWLIEKVENLTDSKLEIKVSEWAEQKRYLPPGTSAFHGFWNNSLTPYLVEIMDCFSINSDVKKVAVQKAAQLGFTTGVLENFIGYIIDHAPGPTMYVTADKTLAEQGIELKIDRMLESSGLDKKIASQVESKHGKKTGNTKSKKEFPGGFLLAIGAQSPGKLRQSAIRYLLMDELDGFPDEAGREGDPVKLAEKRTASFESSRKILYNSTPAIKQTSKIHKLYLRGDQRKYFVPCVKCGHMQELIWLDKETGSGISFETDEDGDLIEESVGYECCKCKALWKNDDKTFFLPRGEWRATAKSKDSDLRSYHLNALYSPAGMYSWTQAVKDWLEAHDLTGAPKILELKSFINTVLGEPWEERGESPKYERVLSRRRAYGRGIIPNRLAISDGAGKIVAVTAGVDIQKECIYIEILAWCKDFRTYSLDWKKLEGSTENPNSVVWQQLDQILTSNIVSDDGKKYNIDLTLVDAGYRTDTVYKFCEQYEQGVFPCMGWSRLYKSAASWKPRDVKGYSGLLCFDLLVDLYKDRLASWINKVWKDGESFPVGYTNYPDDFGESYFKQYESEAKFEVKDAKTGMTRRYEWRTINNTVENHAWDSRVYNMAAFDILADTICKDYLGLEELDWVEVWEFLINRER